MARRSMAKPSWAIALARHFITKQTASNCADYCAALAFIPAPVITATVIIAATTITAIIATLIISTIITAAIITIVMSAIIIAWAIIIAVMPCHGGGSAQRTDHYQP